VRVTTFWEVTVGLMSRSCQEGSFEWLHKNDLEFIVHSSCNKGFSVKGGLPGLVMVMEAIVVTAVICVLYVF
jgi:hypothetical protein